MKRIGIVLFLAGSLWLLGVGVVQAEVPHHPRHHQRSYPYEVWDMLAQPASTREVSFEVLRMLSTGMTPMEVLSRAGRPHYTFKYSRVNRWVYSSTDSWIVEVIFHAGRVIEVKWSRP